MQNDTRDHFLAERPELGRQPVVQGGHRRVALLTVVEVSAGRKTLVTFEGEGVNGTRRRLRQRLAKGTNEEEH